MQNNTSGDVILSSKKYNSISISTVLIFPQTVEVEFQTPDVPYSIFFPGCFLSERGFGVKLFDERFDSLKIMLKFIKNNNIKYVGVSTMTGPQLRYAIRIAKAIHGLNPNINIIFGGVHPTILPETVLQKPYVDYVVRGEGEITFLELLRAIEMGEDVSEVFGVSYKQNGKIIHNPEREFMDIDGISLDWSLLNIENYIHDRNGRKGLAFITSRGCPFRCSFCWNMIVNKRVHRHWSIDKAKHEIEKVAAYGVNYLELFDDNISARRKYLFELCEYFKEKDILWFASVRVDFLAKSDNVKNLHNCAGLYIGTESGSQEMLNLINKDTKVSSIINSAEILKKYNIDGNFSWMVGFPGEQECHVKETVGVVDRIHRILPKAAQRIRIYTPYPGSKMYETAVKYGYKEPRELEQWTFFSREYCVLDYVKNPWFLKCLSYVTFFFFYQGKRRKTRLYYAIPLSMLKIISCLRWRFKSFSFPIEFMALEVVRNWISPKRTNN